MSSFRPHIGLPDVSVKICEAWNDSKHPGRCTAWKEISPGSRRKSPKKVVK